jgi:hypothetical protein
MWSIGGAALTAVLLCAAAVIMAMRRARREIGVALESFDALRHEVADAIDGATRDAGRAQATRQVLLRHGNAATPR